MKATPGVCAVDDCQRPVYIKMNGKCRKHYSQERRAARLRLCEIEGCPRKHHARGMCVTHIARVRRSGTTDPPWIPAEERFWAQVDKTATCWLWLGTVSSGGYGAFSPGTNLSVWVHRYAYHLLVGAIPAGLQLDHLCRVRNCVNPSHLEPVTAWENSMRSDNVAARNARKTECLRGHPFSDENTYISKSGSRHCKACGRYRAQRRANL